MRRDPGVMDCHPPTPPPACNKQGAAGLVVASGAMMSLLDISSIPPSHSLTCSLSIPSLLKLVISYECQQTECFRRFHFLIQNQVKYDVKHKMRAHCER